MFLQVHRFFSNRLVFQPLPDVVFTQGQYFKPRPDTPVHERAYDPSFVEKLELGLNGLLFVQRCRLRKDGPDANDWPPGHTPVQLREEWEEEYQRDLAILDMPTPEDDIVETPALLIRKRKLDDFSLSGPSNWHSPDNSALKKHLRPVMQSYQAACTYAPTVDQRLFRRYAVRLTYCVIPSFT